MACFYISLRPNYRKNVALPMEDKSKHIRQVHPGNCKTKLTPQTIQELNKSLADFLKYFDYEH